ncbi:MAG: YggS family pyridoxal phosphate-dependent enzyme [Bacillota bacterium]
MQKEKLINNLKKVQENIKEAAAKADRDYKEVKLLAVSKKHSFEEVKILNQAGVKFFGESRVQELEEKNENLLSDDIEIDWHFVGHLQRNKVKYLMRMENCRMIQSIDSLRLAKEVNKRAKKNDRKIPILVEINISGDENKFGIKPEKAEEFLNKIINLDFLQIEGLMTILPYLDDSEKLRSYFKKMKKLFDKLSDEVISLNELSMGMTNDYQIAVEEGATIVRVGTAIFGEREY